MVPMGRLSESVAVKCKLAAVPILKMHLRLTRSATAPSLSAWGGGYHRQEQNPAQSEHWRSQKTVRVLVAGLAQTCNSIRDQQVQAGWCASASGLIEALLMAQEEN